MLRGPGYSRNTTAERDTQCTVNTLSTALYAIQPKRPDKKRLHVKSRRSFGYKAAAYMNSDNFFILVWPDLRKKEK